MATESQPKKEGRVSRLGEIVWNFLFSKAEKVSNEAVPGLQVSKEIQTELEKELNSYSLKKVFNDLIKALEGLEKKWDDFENNWLKLIEYYGLKEEGKEEINKNNALSFYRNDKILSHEYGRAKYGMNVTEKQLTQERGLLGTGQGTPPHQPGGELGGSGSENAQDGETEEEVKIDEKMADYFEIPIYPFNLREKTVPNLKRTKFILKYPVPKTAYQTTWNSLIGDKDKVLNDWEFSYFGFNAIELGWIPEYGKIIGKVKDEMSKRVGGEGEYQPLIDSSNTEVNLQRIKDTCETFENIISEYLQKIFTFDNQSYSYLQKMGTLSVEMGNFGSHFIGDFNPLSVLGGIPGRIYYTHTYAIVNPDSLLDVWSWNNVIGLYKELTRVVKRYLIKKKEIHATMHHVKLELDGDRAPLNITGDVNPPVHANMPWGIICKNFWAKYVGDPEKRWFLRAWYRSKEWPKYNILSSEIQTLNPSQRENATKDLDMSEVIEYFKRKPGYESLSDENQDLIKFLRSAIIRYNDLMKQEDRFFIRFENDSDSDVLNYPFCPGYDEHGWPLEVTERGYVFYNAVLDMSDREDIAPITPDEGTVLLDLFNQHKIPNRRLRIVPHQFISEMDLLLKVTCIHNEVDAVRDDLRDGRYHYGSLTITDYLMAMKRSIGSQIRYGQFGDPSKEFGDIWGMGEDELEKEATKFDTKYRGGEPSPNPADPRFFKILRRGTDFINEDLRAPSNLNPAFDRRAVYKSTSQVHLKQWWHLGRKRYYDPADAIWEELDEGEQKALKKKGIVGPAISTRGISIYILEKVLQRMGDYTEAVNELKKLAEVWYDYGPRKFNGPGSKCPLELEEQQIKGANDSVKEAEGH